MMTMESGIAQISNSDNGKGISDLKSDRKFKGLGLAYVNRIMEEHDGELILKSSEFGLTLNLNFPHHG
jgi:two-component sensor histidine kinase